jgi:hypothetical protein
MTTHVLCFWFPPLFLASADAKRYLEMIMRFVTEDRRIDCDGELAVQPPANPVWFRATWQTIHVNVGMEKSLLYASEAGSGK